MAGDARAAIEAVAPGAPEAAVRALCEIAPLCSVLSTPARLAALIGQCAHESGGFRRITENLNYTTASRLVQVWPSRFLNEEMAAPFVRNPEKLANEVYGGRMGNVFPGDGWRFRGRGYLMITGRENYREYGLEDDPERATEPDTAWRVAIEYMNTRSRKGKTAFEWADVFAHREVTRIINGGTTGLSQRVESTERALSSLAP